MRAEGSPALGTTPLFSQQSLSACGLPDTALGPGDSEMTTKGSLPSVSKGELLGPFL